MQVLHLSRNESRGTTLFAFATAIALFSAYVFTVDLLEGVITYLLSLGVAIMAACVLSGRYPERPKVRNLLVE